MTSERNDLLGRLQAIIWSAPDTPRPAWQAMPLRVVRTLVILVRDLARGELTLRAMGLVYTTLLSIVPLLALSFSVLKAFGVSDQLRPMLHTFLEPMGEKGAEVAGRIVQFIENMNVGVLGAVGLALLLYTAISLMQKIEESLNHIWHNPRPRPFGERFSRYLSVLLVGPILVFSALGLTASLMNLGAVRELLAVEVLGEAAQAAGRLVPYLLVIAAFTFVYLYIPNTRVRFVPALIGGAVGGIAWQTAGWLFAVFVASSGKYAAIYSGLAILVLFMIWLYLSWLILLFGASVAFYAQHPEYLYLGAGEPRLSNRMSERLALSVMTLATSRFLAGERAPAPADFTRSLSVPAHALQTVLDALERAGLLVANADDPPRYLPARDPGRILAGEVLDAVRVAGEEGFIAPQGLPAPAQVDRLVERMREAVNASVGTTSLRELVEQAQVAEAGAGAPPAAAPALAALTEEPGDGHATQSTPTAPTILGAHDAPAAPDTPR